MVLLCLLEFYLFSVDTFEDLSRCSAGNSVYAETSKWTGQIVLWSGLVSCTVLKVSSNRSKGKMACSLDAI